MKTKMLIVTDLGLLKVYRYETPKEGSPRITLLEQLVLEPAHLHLTDQITDSAGRRDTPAGKMGGGTMADSHNLQLEVKRRLVKTIARKVEALAGAAGAEGCWLAAHKEIVHPILDELSHAVRSRIEKLVPRDLTKLEPREVLGHFQQTGSPA